jgi:glycine cleavage system protein P-like pyridoxal-binding family
VLVEPTEAETKDTPDGFDDVIAEALHETCQESETARHWAATPRPSAGRTRRARRIGRHAPALDWEVLAEGLRPVVHPPWQRAEVTNLDIVRY